MVTIDTIGFCAGILTTISFVPQVLKIWRTQRSDDVSTPMFVLFSLGVFLWLIYGLSLGSVPITVFNAITLVLSVSVLGLKCKHGRDRRRPK